jgi:tetratricopeptide (TPR) repeat protein
MRTADRGRAVKMTSLVLAVGLLLFSAICGALAQNSPLVPPLDNALADLYQHAEDLLYQSNDPAAALEEAKKFESEVKKRFGTNNWQYGRALELIGTIYQGMGRTDEAAPYLRQGGVLRESSSAGASSPAELPQKLYEKALMYSSYGRFIEAEPVYERALKLREQAVGLNHPDTAMYLYGVGFVYGALQRYADAEPFLVRTLSAQAKLGIPNDSNMARGLVQLALAYQNMDHPVEAEALYKRAITILSASLGPEHSGVAQVLNNLGSLYLELGRNAEGERGRSPRPNSTCRRMCWQRCSASSVKPGSRIKT